MPAVILSMPLAGTPRLERGFSPRHPSGFPAGHTGVDWAVRSGTSVLAAGAGTVSHVGWNLGGGLGVHIDHGGGVETLYYHLQAAFVKKGDPVSPGRQIALSGSSGLVTGPHLHFEVKIGGQNVDPLPYVQGGAPNAQPAPAGDPDAYPLDPGKVCAAGYHHGTVDPRAYVLIPGTPWFARPRNPDGTVNACIRDGVEPGEGVGADLIQIDWPSVIEPGLNVALVLVALALAWVGVQRILRA